MDHTDEEARAARQKYLQRRRNELLRRTTETILLAGIVVLAVHGCECWARLLEWHRAELLTHIAVLAAVLGLYPLRLMYYSWRNQSRLKLGQRIHLPAAFDPATILYPPVLPVLIAISLFPSSPKLLVPNLLLGLAALPARVIPFKSSALGYSPLHWLLSILPLIAAGSTIIPSWPLSPKPYRLELPPGHQDLDPELLVTLFPLHQALLPPLYYLTTTSLLPTELHLLSIGLINLYLFSDSPQAIILMVLLWLGGLGVFLLCGKVLKWGVALARIPRWRLRRAGQVIRARQNFLQVLNQSLGSKNGAGGKGRMSDSDADDDEAMHLHKTKSLKLNIFDPVRGSKESAKGAEPQSAVEAAKPGSLNLQGRIEGSQSLGRKRRNTLPVLAAEDHTSQHRYANRKRTTSIAQSYLSLTPGQATVRKWLYAGYFYVVVVGLILGPIRYAIGKHALHGHEPFGWAISYLFGNIADVRWKVFTWNLDWWVPYPQDWIPKSRSTTGKSCQWRNMFAKSCWGKPIRVWCSAYTVRARFSWVSSRFSRYLQLSRWIRGARCSMVPWWPCCCQPCTWTLVLSRSLWRLYWPFSSYLTSFVLHSYRRCPSPSPGSSRRTSTGATYVGRWWFRTCSSSLAAQYRSGSHWQACNGGRVAMAGLGGQGPGCQHGGRSSVRRHG
ncbi:hypothetical protein P3342_002108 [Pyrenophora teres f. teres]|nr:hypothetical protein P3342_002108 [Pyrenophora teres f. teres]